METGFINTDEDNRIFDERFNEVAQAIATGIEEAVPLKGAAPKNQYAVQIGLFKYESNADYQAELARDAGFDAEISYSAPYYVVQVPDGDNLDQAAQLEAALRRAGFDTLIVTKQP